MLRVNDEAKVSMIMYAGQLVCSIKFKINSSTLKTSDALRRLNETKVLHGVLEVARDLGDDLLYLTRLLSNRFQ